MPLASSKQLPMMSLLHYLMLTLFHSRFLLPVPKLAHRLYNAAASSPSRPREGDSLAITIYFNLYKHDVKKKLKVKIEKRNSVLHRCRVRLIVSDEEIATTISKRLK